MLEEIYADRKGDDKRDKKIKHYGARAAGDNGEAGLSFLFGRFSIAIVAPEFCDQGDSGNKREEAKRNIGMEPDARENTGHDKHPDILGTKTFKKKIYGKRGDERKRDSAESYAGEINMPINQEAGRSVYIKENVRDEENRPLYQAVREIIKRDPKAKTILDLGCSDLVASRKLAEEIGRAHV